MTFWIGLGLLLFLMLGFLLWPWWRGSRSLGRRKAHDLAVYRAQLDEIQQEEARGALSPEEAQGVRLEIQRRLLRTDAAAEPEREGGSRLSQPQLVVSTLFVAFLPILAIGLYLLLGRPDLALNGGRAPQVAGDHGGGGMAAPQSEADIQALLQKLRDRLAAEPGRLDGWLLLGRTEMNLGNYRAAYEAFARASALAPDDGDIHAYRGEAIVFAADGVIGPEALRAFQEALQHEPAQPSARYYVAMARLQGGDRRGAFDGLLALAKDAEIDAPWLPVVREKLEELARGLGIDLASQLPPPAMPAPKSPALPPVVPVPGAPGPSREQMEAAQTMSREDQQAMIRGMVDRLAERLKDNPNDPAGWLRLGQAREVLGEKPAAREALQKAIALLPAGSPERRDAEARLERLKD